MRPYEVVLILESSAEDSTVQGVVDRVKNSIAPQGGTLGQVHKWGRRRFAYELKHRWEGYYALAEINTIPESVAELDRVLTLSDDVVRHKIVRVPEVVAGRKQPASSSAAPAQADAAAESESTGAPS